MVRVTLDINGTIYTHEFEPTNLYYDEESAAAYLAGIVERTFLQHLGNTQVMEMTVDKRDA